MISEEKLKELKKDLPRGSVTRISENTGLSKGYVTEVLKGTYFNEDIINEAIKLRDDAREEREKLEAKI